MQDNDKQVLALMTAAMKTLGEMLYEHTNQNFSLIILSCPEGEKNVRITECVENETVRKGMGSVLGRAIYGEVPEVSQE